MKKLLGYFIWEKSILDNKGISINFSISRYCYIKPTSCKTLHNVFRKSWYNKPYESYYICSEKVFYWLWFRLTFKTQYEFISKLNKEYTFDDMVQASKYGYEFRDTTSFPEHKFEDSCINNTKQWIHSLDYNE